MLAISGMRAGKVTGWWRALPFDVVDLVPVHGGPVGTYRSGGEARDIPSMIVLTGEHIPVRSPGMPV